MYLMDRTTEPTALIDDIYDYVGGSYTGTYKGIDIYDINYQKTWVVLEQDGENYAACTVYDQSLDQVKKSIDELDGGEIAHNWDNVAIFAKINRPKDLDKQQGND